MKTFILAGSQKEYEDFMRMNNQHVTNIAHLHSSEQLTGVRAGIIILCGTYSKREDYNTIINVAKQRDFIITVPYKENV